MKKGKKRKFFCICIGAVALLLCAFINYIPFSLIGSPLGHPEEISRLNVEFTDLHDREGSFSIEEREEIETLCGYLKDAHLAYMGSNSGIDLDPETDDFILTLWTDDRKESIYLKKDGSLYTSVSRFINRGGQVAKLFQHVENVYLKE